MAFTLQARELRRPPWMSSKPGRRRGLHASKLRLLALALVAIAFFASRRVATAQEDYLPGRTSVQCIPFVRPRASHGAIRSYARMRLCHRAGHCYTRRSAATDATAAAAMPDSLFSGPAKLQSPVGQLLQNMMSVQSELVDYAIDQQLVTLQQEAEGDENASSVLEGWNDEDLELRKRFVDVRLFERERTRADLLYMMVCDEFRRLSAPLARAVPRVGGRANLGPKPKEGALTKSLHSPQVLRAVNKHLERSLPQASTMKSREPMLFLWYPCGQAYAMSLLYGYVIRRTERRFKLERSLFPVDDGNDESLGNYLDAMPLKFQGAMLTLEAQLAAEAQVAAQFGDLAAVRSWMIDQLRSAPSGVDPQAYLKDLSMSGKYPALVLTVDDFHRLLLEAVAFGVLLCEAEARAQAVSTLTPAVEDRLDKFGINTEDY